MLFPLSYPLYCFTSKRTLSLADRECVSVCVRVLKFKGSSSQRPPAECVKLKNLSELWINGISLSLLFRLCCTSAPPFLLSSILLSRNSLFICSVHLSSSPLSSSPHFSTSPCIVPPLSYSFVASLFWLFSSISTFLSPSSFCFSCLAPFFSAVNYFLHYLVFCFFFCLFVCRSKTASKCCQGQKFRPKFSQYDCCYDPHLHIWHDKYGMKWNRVHYTWWHCKSICELSKRKSALFLLLLFFTRYSSHSLTKPQNWYFTVWHGLQLIVHSVTRNEPVRLLLIV